MDHPTCQTRRPPSDLPTTVSNRSHPQLHLYHYLFPRLRLSKTIWFCFSAIATVHHYLYYQCFYESLSLFLTHTHTHTHTQTCTHKKREKERVSEGDCEMETEPKQDQQKQKEKERPFGSFGVTDTTVPPLFLLSESRLSSCVVHHAIMATQAPIRWDR